MLVIDLIRLRVGDEGENEFHWQGWSQVFSLPAERLVGQENDGDLFHYMGFCRRQQTQRITLALYDFICRIPLNSHIYLNCLSKCAIGLNNLSSNIATPRGLCLLSLQWPRQVEDLRL